LEKIETALPGVLELRPRTYGDARGFFLETYNRKEYEKIGIRDTFVQDNHSYSLHGTLRGLHYQLRHPQAKLCRVTEGAVLDVIADVRRGSPNFGMTVTILLTAEMRNQVYIPEGFAHGLAACNGVAQFLYKCSDFYDPRDEYGIIWNDPTLAISWGLEDPMLSPKDSTFPRLDEVLKNYPELLPQYSAE
jgi:dTDP-4-dehydrorhamnose 3,5-epimerase